MRGLLLAVILALVGIGGCSEGTVAPLDGTRPRAEETELCVVSGLELTASGVAKDGIPALSNPSLVDPGSAGTEQVQDEDMVIGMVMGGRAVALPLSIMWWHEIVNFDEHGVRVAVTYCPLTGTAVAFDRSGIGNHELGVSGILLENNLVMYDRATDESLWAQMLGGAICGSATGRTLATVPLLVMTYTGWRALHPDTKVVSSDTGWDRDYRVNPYADYERLDAPPLYITENNRDRRRLPKERVLGIADPDGGLAIPFQVLDTMDRAVLDLEVGTRTVTVFWDKAMQAAAAYGTTPVWAEGYAPPVSGGLTFEDHPEGFRDVQTGSVWTIEGFAVAGPAEGSRLIALPDAMVAYWFAWAAFNPGTEILTGF